MKEHLVINKTENYTHTSITGGSWIINDDELDLFMIYILKRYKEEERQLHLTEDIKKQIWTNYY